MTKHRRYLPWITGLLLATGLFILLQLFSHIRYENSDDILIVKSFMGFEGGIPATYNLYLHTFLAHLLGWLSTLIPGVAWFSLLQLFLLWFSTAVITKCVMQCAMSRKVPLWVGLMAALVFAGTMAVFACARVNFTTTAALTGAAAVAQLTTLAFEEKRPFWQAFFSALLMLMCFVLRPQSMLPVVPFWLLALLWVLITRRRQGVRPLPRAFATAFILGAACLMVLAGVRAWEQSSPQLSALVDFQDANLGPMDYDENMLLAVPDETLASIGWSRAELELVRQWYFMDANITADAFRQLEAATAVKATLSSRLSGAFNTLGYFYRDNPRYLSAAIVLLLLCGLCAVLPAEKNRLRHTALAALLCLPLMAAMLLFLAFQGRFLGRAADCAIFPGAALLCCLTTVSLGSYAGAVKPRKAVALGLSVLCLCAAGLNLRQTTRVLSSRPDVVSATREADLETFALEHPDMLILRTPDLLRDTRILPDVSQGIPANIMIWGDWYCRTPSWYRQLEVFGFDGYRFSSADFLKENLLFVTTEATPPAALLTYVGESGGSGVSFTLYGQRGELQFFRFLP